MNHTGYISISYEFGIIVVSIVFLVRMCIYQRFHNHDSAYKWLVLWLICSTIFSALRFSQIISTNEMIAILSIRGQNAIAYAFGPYVCVNLVYSYAEIRVSRKANLISSILCGIMAIAVSCTSAFYTYSPSLKHTIFNENFIGVTSSSLFPLAAIIPIVSMIWAAYILRKNKTAENNILAVGFIVGLFFVMSDLAQIFFNNVWLRLFDLQFVLLGITFEIIQYRQFMAFNNNLETAINEKTMALKTKVDELHKKEEQLLAINKRNHILAYFDELTGLPNKLSLYEWADTYGETIHIQEVSIFLINIDNYSSINEFYGHKNAGLFISNIARILEDLKKDNSVLFKFSDNQFVFACFNNPSQDNEEFAKTIYSNFTYPLRINSIVCKIMTSIGIASISHTEDIYDGLKMAETALNYVKKYRINSYKKFDDKLRIDTARKHLIENELNTALEKDEFYLCYQPQLDISSGNIRGFEALLRWENSKLGVVGPTEFIPIAEEIGMINDIGKWVIREVMANAIKIKDMYGIKYIFSINISVTQLFNRELIEMLEELKISGKLYPDLIEFEITESIFALENYDAIGALNKISTYGISLALDDFGTGYSSLSYLKELPISVLKIDKAFISESQSKTSITDCIVSLGHKLGMEVIAEGVETNAQLEAIKKLKCNYIQGYLFSKPLEERYLFAFINENLLRCS